VTSKPDAAVRAGWTDAPRGEADVASIRDYLEANNGIDGLEILKPSDVKRAVELFRRDGFVVIGDILNDEQIEILASGCNTVIEEILALVAIFACRVRQTTRGCTLMCMIGFRTPRPRLVHSMTRLPR
jgi:hypothetical protein